MPKTKRGERIYADNWGKICFKARNMTANRCPCCLRRAEVVHHLYYRKGLLQRRIYGNESPLIDVIPLCRPCHGMVHEKQHWLKHRSDPDRDRNTTAMIWSLRLQSWIVFVLTRRGVLLALLGLIGFGVVKILGL